MHKLVIPRRGCISGWTWSLRKTILSNILMAKSIVFSINPYICLSYSSQDIIFCRSSREILLYSEGFTPFLSISTFLLKSTKILCLRAFLEYFLPVQFLKFDLLNTSLLLCNMSVTCAFTSINYCSLRSLSKGLLV